MINEKFVRKNTKKQHTTYRLKDGTIVPSVTLILSQLGDQSLMYWANNLGKQGLDYSNTLKSYARKGTFVHELIHENLTNEFDEKVLEDLTDNEKALGYKCFSHFYSLLKENDVEMFESEKQYVSEEYKFGGTIDFIGKFNGKTCLLDFKTSKSFHLKHFLQLSAYKQLYEENNDCIIESLVVVRLNENSDSYEYLEIEDMDLINQMFKLFRVLLIMNVLKKDIEIKFNQELIFK